MSLIGEVTGLRPMHEDIWYLEGKCLEQVSAEAASLGLSYGEYVTAVKTGKIESVLWDRGVYDGPERIRKADHRRKRRLYRYGNE